jgi:uncharacterized membrane protein YidH (DUF202 family)
MRLHFRLRGLRGVSYLTPKFSPCGAKVIIVTGVTVVGAALGHGPAFASAMRDRTGAPMTKVFCVIAAIALLTPMVFAAVMQVMLITG